MAAELKKTMDLNVELIRGRGGVFKVRVGEEIVAQKTMQGFPSPEEVVAAVRLSLIHI